MAEIVALNTSKEKGTVKTEKDQVEIIEDFGIKGDAHAGKWHRQVSFLAEESVRDFEKKLDRKIDNGAFGENILTRGLDLAKLPIGTVLTSGQVSFEISQIGKECHKGCAIRQMVGDCIMPREGIFAKVLKGGQVKKGDEIHIESFPPYRFSILTVSDKGSQGLREDTSGDAIEEIFTSKGYDLAKRDIVPDDREKISAKLLEYSDKDRVDLVLTSGGTGFSPRDVTPEATLDVIEKRVPGIGELMRFESYKITDRAILSRAQAGIRKKTLIINLPGSEKAVRENISAFIGPLKHGLDILTSRDGECGGRR